MSTRQWRLGVDLSNLPPQLCLRTKTSFEGYSGGPSGNFLGDSWLLASSKHILDPERHPEGAREVVFWGGHLPYTWLIQVLSLAFHMVSPYPCLLGVIPASSGAGTKP